MNIIKRALAICLSMALLLTLCPALPIAAAEEQIIFADDFSGYEAEQSPAETTKAEDWNDKATSATAEIKVVEKDKNKVLCITDSAEKAGGPRISKALYLKGVDDLTVTFRAKSEGSASIGFWVLSNKTAVFSHRGASTSWTDFKVEIDLKKKEYAIYADGKLSGEGSFENALDAQVAYIRFAGSIKNGGCAYYDDIVISTKTDIDLAKLFDPTNVTGEGISVIPGLATDSDHTKDYKTAAAVKKIAPASNKIIFEENFNSYNAGGVVEALPDTAGRFTERASSGAVTITAEDKDSDRVLRIANTGASSGPRIGKTLYPEGIKTLYVSFMARSVGAGTVTFSVLNSLATAVSVGGGHSTWTAYEYVLDLEAKTYICYKNGKESEKGTFGADLDSQLTIRFGGSVRDGGCVFYDNICISTPDTADLELIQIGTRGEPMTKSQHAKKASAHYKGEPAQAVSTPSGAIQLFYYDNNQGGKTVTTGTDGSWTKIMTGDTVLANTVNDNQLILAVNPRSTKVRSALTKLLSLGEQPGDLTVEYSVYFIGTGAGARLGMMADSTKDLLANTPELSAAHPAVQPGWNHIKYTFDMQKKTYSAFVNGKALETNAAFASEAKNLGDLTAMFNFKTNTGNDIVLLDNVVMYTYTQSVYSTMLFGSQGVNWDLVKGKPITEDSFVSNLRQHPRLLINNWDEMREKIAKDEMCASWYADLLKMADELLTAPNYPYVFENGRNWLLGGRNVRYRLMTLAFVYNMTGDEKYKNRALEEMRSAATYPDWSNSAPIISSECMHGYAIAYDWMYHALTESEKAEIRKAICDKALWQFVHAYEGKISVEINRGNSNRTLVANSAALQTAIALADEMPDVANYIYENALTYAQPPLLAYAADGGFPEGSMYWDYATTFAVLLMTALEKAPVDGYTHDAAAKWFFELPQMKNTVKYSIYLNSTDKKFNFGDASEGIMYSPTLYWFASYTDEPFYKWYENNLLKTHQTTFTSMIDLIDALIWYDADMSTDNVTPISPDGMFNSETSAVATMRSSFADTGALFAAIQGGSNKTGHMHKSLGNFALDANGQRFIHPIGALDYSAQFDDSYYYTKRTEGQNTILFNPDASIGQNVEALAMFTDFKSDEDEAFAVLDMTQTHETVESAKRGMLMTKGRKSVVLQDEFKMKKPSEIYWFAQTHADIKLAQDGMSAVLELGGERMLVVLTQAPAGAKLSVMGATPLPTSPRAGDEALKSYYKLAVHLTNVTEGTIRVEFIPLEKGETPDVSRATSPQPISAWALDATVPAPTAQEDFASAVALKLGSPVSFAGGQRTYVDTNNYAVMPIETGGRTLVPVRFISEKIGGNVYWDEALQQVKIVRGNDEILLYIGSNEMTVNGQVTYLDVPAQTINDRTMIPLRAMVEAVGKSVFWDDRGLILISDEAHTPSEDAIVRMLGLLDTRVLWGDGELTWFDRQIADYKLTPQADNTIRVLACGNEVPVTPTADGASFTIDGKNYNIHFANDSFKDLIGTSDPNVVAYLEMSSRILSISEQRAINYIPVQSAEMSTGHDKYISQGTIDNVISSDMINRWSGQGDGAYIIYDLGYKQNIHSFGLAVYQGTTRQTLFSVSVSDDGENWTQLIDTETSGETELFDIFKLGDVQARYVKVTGYGTTAGNMYNSWTEVRFWANAEQEAADEADWSQNGLTGAMVYHTGDQIQLAVSTTNIKGSTVAAPAITFTADKPGVVDITPDGKVTFIGAGDVTITATYNNGFKTLTSTLKARCAK